MQFKLAKTYRYWWPVKLRVPDPATPGSFTDQELRVEFEPLPQEELTAAQEESAALTTLREVTAHGIRQVKRVVRNWDGVVDDAGNPVPFSDGALEQALQHAWFRAGLQKALADSQNGAAARLGN